MNKLAVIALAALIPLPALADDKIGIFETIHESSLSFPDTTAALDEAFVKADLVLYGSHVVRVPEGAQQAKVYVFTSPTFACLNQPYSSSMSSLEALGSLLATSTARSNSSWRDMVVWTARSRMGGSDRAPSQLRTRRDSRLMNHRALRTASRN